jgi:hypothetical protein
LEASYPNIRTNGPSIQSRIHDNPVVREAVRGRMEYLASKIDRLYSLETYFTILYEGGPVRHRFSPTTAPLLQPQPSTPT